MQSSTLIKLNIQAGKQDSYSKLTLSLLEYFFFASIYKKRIVMDKIKDKKKLMKAFDSIIKIEVDVNTGEEYPVEIDVPLIDDDTDWDYIEGTRKLTEQMKNK